MHWINEFLEAWERTERTTDWRTIRPFSVDAICPYFYDIVIQKILQAIDLLKDYPQEKLHELFVGPVNTRNVFVVLLSYCKLYKIPKAERLKLAEFFYKVFKSYDSEDPLTYDGHSRFYSEKEIQKIIKESKWVRATPENAREIGKLCAILDALYYELYTDMMPSLGGDFNGPYDVSWKFGKGKWLVARDQFNLKPTEVWPHTKRYRYKSVYLFTVYDMPVKIDFYGNIITHKNKGFVETLYAYTTKVDGKVLNSIEQIVKLREYFSERLTEQTKILEKLNLEDMKKKFVKMDALEYQKLLAAAGLKLDFKELFKRVEGKPLIEGWGMWNQPKPPTEADRKFYRDIMDPRKEVYWEQPKWKS
jgi:hypothetical protein